jgi:hypothetical protein
VPLSSSLDEVAWLAERVVRLSAEDAAESSFDVVVSEDSSELRPPVLLPVVFELLPGKGGIGELDADLLFAARGTGNVFSGVGCGAETIVGVAVRSIKTGGGGGGGGGGDGVCFLSAIVEETGGCWFLFVLTVFCFTGMQFSCLKSLNVLIF